MSDVTSSAPPPPASTSAAPAAPAQGATPDPKAAAQAKGREILAARGLLRSSTSPASAAAAAPASASATTASLSASPSSTSPAASGGAPESSQVDPEPEADSALAKRLARIARAEDGIKSRESAVAAKEAQLQKWQAFEDAKTKSGRVAALKALFDADDLTGPLYQELTDEVLASAKPESEDDRLRKRVAEEVERREKERREAEEKDRGTRAEQVQRAYVAGLQEALRSTPEKWPLVHRIGVARSDIFRQVESVFSATGRAPSETEVLDFFERHLSSTVEASGKYARKAIEAPQTGGAATPTDNTRAGQGQAEMPPIDAPYEARVAAIKRRFLKS